MAWRQTAEFVEKWFNKGKMIAVQGSIRTGSYTNNEGRKVYTTDILVDKVNFCGDKGSEPKPQTAETSSQTRYEQGTRDDFDSFDDGDFPF